VPECRARNISILVRVLVGPLFAPPVSSQRTGPNGRRALVGGRVGRRSPPNSPPRSGGGHRTPVPTRTADATRATWIITLIGFILFNKILFNIIVTPALPCGGAVRMMPTKRLNTNKWGDRDETD